MRLRTASLRFLFAVLAVTVSAGSALAAAGLNLSWDDCGSAGTMQKTFACDTNLGVHVLVASAVTGYDMAQLNGEASEMELTSNQEALSSWWQLDNPLYGTNGCRYGAESVSFNFSSMGSCVDPWGGAAQGGSNFWTYAGTNRTRMRTVGAIPSPGTSINGTDEYYFFKVVITNAKTVGSSCGGCSDGAAIVFSSLLLTQPYGANGDHVINTPLQRNYVLWQSGASVESIPNPTPIKTTTWGAVKSLYRK